MGNPRHAFILGAGIAGLSLAEILSRNGFRITVLESASVLGGDASRATQNWLHTGWLYAALPGSAAMLGCHRALGLFHATYDSVLPPSILNLELTGRGVSYPQSEEGWFSAEVVQYLYALSTWELSVLEKQTWGAYLAAVPLRRLRSLGYSTRRASAIPENLAALLDHWEGGTGGRKKYAVIPSTDAQIHTRRVMDSLLALLGERTELVLGAKYDLVQKDGKTVVLLDGEAHTPDLVVLASGKSIPAQLRQLEKAGMASQFKSISSPIAVLDRELDLPSFIRFTPRVAHTVNHIKYQIEGRGELSTLGSYEYYPAGQEPDISPFVDRICGLLNISPEHVLDTYYGTKTEFTGAAERRYNHAIERVNENSYFAIPGKFSQFPLLVHDFAMRLGLRTDISNETRGTLLARASLTAPERIAAELGFGARAQTRYHAS
jgi:glycine/D-amino acid oxidase-like deaminating enzyme